MKKSSPPKRPTPNAILRAAWSAFKYGSTYNLTSQRFLTTSIVGRIFFEHLPDADLNGINFEDLSWCEEQSEAF